MTQADGAKPFRVLVAGVGGQGVLTAARILGEAAAAAGLSVALGQLHGMSQRGGSVESSVIVGGGGSTFIPPGGADVLLGLEPLETVRAGPSVSSRTAVLTNSGRLVPQLLAQAGQPYPELEPMLFRIRQTTDQVVVIDGSVLARELGEPRALNIVMLGALAGLDVLPFDAATLGGAVSEASPPDRVEQSRRAFELGREATAS